MSAPGLAERRAALDLIDAVLGQGAVLDGGQLAGGLTPPQRAGALRLAASTLRHLGRIDAILDGFIARPPPDRVRNILRLATAELLIEGTAPHAAVSQAVAIAAAGKRTLKFKGLINAVSRRVAEDGLKIWHAQDPAGLVWSPEIRGLIARAWGRDALVSLAGAHHDPPPLDLSLRDGRTAGLWADRLKARILPTGSLRLIRAGQISKLPGYDEGAWWVQDAAAALPVRMLSEPRGLRVLDLCAAPGGKTLQLAALGAQVTAVDISESRLERLRENLDRTGLGADVVAADALKWSPDARFDAVILDAPCSATGTMRRHPDLPHRRKKLDLHALTTRQDELMDRAWGWVAPGGTLLYATCSLLAQEGEERVRSFLKRTAHARLTNTSLSGAEPHWLSQGQLRVRPDDWADLGGMDGFFAAGFQHV